MVLLSSHGMEFNSPHACVSPHDVKGHALGLPHHAQASYVRTGPSARQGKLAIVPETPCHTETGLGVSVLPSKCVKYLGPRASSSILLECLGKWLWGLSRH